MNLANINTSTHQNFEGYPGSDNGVRSFSASFQTSPDEFSDGETPAFKKAPMSRALIMFVIILAVLPVLIFEFFKSWIQQRF